MNNHFVRPQRIRFQLQRLFFALVLSATTVPSLAVIPADLGRMTNQVFLAGEGFNSAQFAPDGRLGFIAWKGQQLILRERSTNGTWSEQIIGNGGATFQAKSYD